MAWTQFFLNGAWAGQAAVFIATPGTVTLENDILFEKLIFDAGGYRIESPAGCRLYANDHATIQVNMGRATISALMDVAGTLLKSGGGLLDLRSVVSAAWCAAVLTWSSARRRCGTPGLADGGSRGRRR